MPTANQDGPVLSRAFEAAVRFFFRTWCPLHVTGLANIPEPPFLVCANHVSHLDSLVLMLATGQRFHRFALLAASDYFFGHNLRHRMLSLVLTLIPIDRAARPTSFQYTLERCEEFLRSGRALILFPEGTRSVAGSMGPFKRGASVLSRRLDIPLLPARISGTDRVLPKGVRLPRCGPVFVDIGVAIRPGDHACPAQEARLRILELRAVPK